MIVLSPKFLNSLFAIVTILFCFSSPVWAVSTKNTSNTFDSALNHVRQQSYEQAWQEFTQVIQEDTNMVAAAYSDRCLVNLKLNNYPAAVFDCTKAIEANPDNLEAHLNLGLAYYRLEEYQNAIAQDEEVIRLNHHDYRAYYNRGLVAAALQEYSQASEYYTLALKSEPNIPSAQRALIYNDLGTAHIMLSDYQNAIAFLNLALEIEPKNYTLYFNRGCAHHRQGNKQAGVDDFTQAIKLQPDFTQAYVSRAMLYHFLHDQKAAFEDLDIALKQYLAQGDNPSYQRILALKQKIAKSPINKLLV